MGLSGCVYKKRVKIRNKLHFTTSCIWYFCHITVFVFFQIFKSYPKSWISYSSKSHGITLSEVIKFCTRKMIKRIYLMSPRKMINLFHVVVTNFSPKKWELWVDMSPRIMRTRFQGHMQFLWSIGHSWSQKITKFWGPKKVLYVRKIKPYIHFFSLSTHQKERKSTHGLWERRPN